QLGLKGEEAAAAGEALALLDAGERAGRPFRLLLADSRLPDLDGPALAKVVKARPGSLPVVLLCAYGERGHMQALATDAAGCVSKPVRLVPLRECLTRTLAAGRGPTPSGSIPVLRAPQPGATPGAQARLLLAEDNAVNQKLALRMLE